MTEPTTALRPAEPNSLATREPEANPMTLIQSALDRGMKVDELTRLFDLQERWENARKQEAFAQALTEFQAECPRIKKDRKTTGGKFQFGYASLDDIDKVIRPILGRLGIVVTFDSDHRQAGTENVINVTVRVRVGTYYEDRRFGCPIPKDLSASDSQKWGAALSYAKRYALCAALNIVVTDEDNEGHLADTITATQMLDIKDLLKQCPKDTESGMLNWLKVDSLDLIPRNRFNEVMTQLNKKSGQQTKGGA